jgi:small-conductance mechanosensitive channel
MLPSVPGPRAAFLIWLAAALCAAPAAAQVSSADHEAELAEVPTAAVTLDGNTLFRIRGVTGYPAEKRAEDMLRRIRSAARNPKLDPASLHTVETDVRTEIYADGVFVVAALDRDARLEAVTRQELALAWVDILKEAIRNYRSARTREELLLGAARAGGATSVLVVFVVLVQLLSRRLDSTIVYRFRRRIEALQERSFEIVRAERVKALIRAAVRMLRLALVLAAAFVYLRYVLGVFPWTRAASVELGSWFLDPLEVLWRAFVRNVPNLIFLAVLAVVVRYLLGLLHVFFQGVERGAIRIRDFEPEWAAPTERLVRLVGVAFALVVAYPYIPGSGSDAFKAVSIFFGVVLSLGSSSLISNMVAGLILTYRRTFKLGDCVQIGPSLGEVTAMRLQATHLRTQKNEEVVVPNSTILNTDVLNYSTLARGSGLILHTSVGIGYEAPWRQVEAMLLLAAQRSSLVEKSPAPFVLQRSLGDFAVNYELNAHLRDPDPDRILRAYSELHRNVQDVFNEYGVQIMTPNYMADTAQPKLVPKEQWYAAPARPAPAARQE